MNINIPRLKEISLNRFRTEKERGFTLPEILIAIVIFGVLAAITIPILVNQQKAANESTLDTDLLSAEMIIQNERGLNNGVYPSYTPNDISQSDWESVITYTYSTSQLEYCLKADLNGLIKYIGSKTNGDITTTACTFPNVGGAQPTNEDTNTGPPANNHNPSITSISPATLYSRAGGETITVNGADFLNGAAVLYDGTPVSATVLTANRLTFVNPGASSYRNIEIQVKNPNARTSDPVNLALVNPILGTTAATPALITTNEAASGTNITATATAISCPFGASPRYAFKLVRLGYTYNSSGSGIYARNVSDGNALYYWRADRTVVISAQMGQRYGLTAKAICTLEGRYGNESGYTAEKIFVEPITTPAGPAYAPWYSPSTVVINQPVTVYWAETSCYPGTTRQYLLYRNWGGLYQGPATSYGFNARSTAGTDAFFYRYRCYTPFASSAWTAVSPTRYMQVLARPNPPAAATGLRITNNQATWVSVAWNAVSCNIGQAQYRVQWWGASSGLTGWMTGTSYSFGTVNGRDYGWRVIASCVNLGERSGDTYSYPAYFTTTVRGPSGGWGSINNNGWATIYATGGFSCAYGATIQYRAIRTVADYSTGRSDAWWGWRWNTPSTDFGGNQGARLGGYLQARCVSNDGRHASYTINSWQIVWAVSVQAPWYVPGWWHGGNPRGERWSAVWCPAGTYAVYWTYARGDYGNGIWGPWESANFYGYDRWYYSYGNTMVNSWLMARCTSDFRSSGWGPQGYARY